MASDLRESEAAARADMSFHNSTANYVPPRRTHEEVGHRRTSSPSSSGVSGEGDEEELDDLHHRTAHPLEPCEEAQESEEQTGPDNEEEARRGRRCSTPTGLPQSGPVGRSVSLKSQFLEPITCLVAARLINKLHDVFFPSVFSCVLTR